MLQLQVLLDEEIEAIHQAALLILAETGVVFTHPAGREILTGAGGTVQGDRLLLPAELVERCLQLCPHQVRLHGRGGMVKTLGDGSLHWHNLGGARGYLRPPQREAPPALSCRMCATAPACWMPWKGRPPSHRSSRPWMCPETLMSLAMYRHALPYTTKPLQGPGVQICCRGRTRQSAWPK